MHPTGGISQKAAPRPPGVPRRTVLSRAIARHQPKIIRLVADPGIPPRSAIDTAEGCGKNDGPA
jgi:hypothetical protein